VDSKSERRTSLVESDKERLEENVAIDLEGAALVGLDAAEAHCDFISLARYVYLMLKVVKGERLTKNRS
jgi:hypothetical protein